MDEFKEFIKKDNTPISKNSLYDIKKAFDFSSESEVMQFAEKIIKEGSPINNLDEEILNSLLISVICYVMALTENKSDNNLQSCLEVIESNIKMTKDVPTSCFYANLVKQFSEDHPARGVFEIVEKELSNEEINSYFKKLKNIIETITA